MKKTAIVALVIFGIFILAAKVNAESLTSDRAYQDYQYNLSIYNQAYSDYQDAKNAYRANPTLALKEDARKKTLTMLRDRDQLIIVYLTALRAKIAETNGLSSDDKNNIFGKIDSEVGWYTDHKGKYEDGNSLDDIFGKSSDAENRYKDNTYPAVYESLFDISLGTEISFRQDHEQIYSNLKDTINAGVQSGKLTMDPFNRWFTDIDSLVGTLKTNEDQAKGQAGQIYTQYYSVTGSYNTAIQTLTSSLKSLSQLNEFLTEVLTSITNQQ